MGLGFLLKLLGLGKTLLNWLWDAVKAIVAFAFKKPFVFFTIVLSLALAGTLWYAYGLQQDLTAAQTTIAAKDKFISEQDKSLRSYVKALDTERETLRKTIETNNKAVADLKRVADQALANAQKEAAKAEAKRQEYIALATKYRNANPSTGTAEERIQREQKTNDDFFADWRRAQ